jgi:hypothetical protein
MVGEAEVTAGVDDLIGESTTRNGKGVEVVPQRGFVGEGVDTEGEAGDDANWVVAEAANQLVDRLFTVSGVFAGADDREEGQLSGRQGAAVVESLRWLRNFP